jgi:hypothetical protein
MLLLSITGGTVAAGVGAGAGDPHAASIVAIKIKLAKTLTFFFIQSSAVQRTELVSAKSEIILVSGVEASAGSIWTQHLTG